MNKNLTGFAVFAIFQDELFVTCFLIGPENNNTSFFINISHCFAVRVSNQLAFRVRRAAK